MTQQALSAVDQTSIWIRCAHLFHEIFVADVFRDVTLLELEDHFLHQMRDCSHPTGGGDAMDGRSEKSVLLSLI